MTQYALTIITRATHTAWRVRIGTTDSTITRDDATGEWVAESGPFMGRTLGVTRRHAVRTLRGLAAAPSPSRPEVSVGRVTAQSQ